MGRHRKLDASFKAKVAISTLKPLRVLAMIGIGAVLAVLFYFIGIPQKITGVLTGMKGIVPGFLFAWYAFYNPRGYCRLMYFEGTDSPILILIYNR